MKKLVNIGLDIGIASVGWCIWDIENNTIVNRGVRTFEELKDAKTGKLANQKRRDCRHIRRTNNRRKTRKETFIKGILDFNGIFSFSFDGEYDSDKKEMLKLKNKFLTTYVDNKNTDNLSIILEGLEKEISKEKLVKILYYYLGHRGYTFESVDDYNKKIETIKNTENKDENILDLSNLYPSQIQANFLKENGYFRGNSLNGKISIFDFKKEIEKILSNQNYINQDFKEWYFSIFMCLRDWATGAGSPKWRTNSGIYSLDIDENGNEITYNTLWEKNIGKCSVYTNEYRTQKKSFSSEIAVFLDMLNTIKVNPNTPNRSDYDRLLQKEKESIMFDIIVNKTTINLKLIAKHCNFTTNDILSGFRTKNKKDKDTKNEDTRFPTLSNTKKIIQILKQKINFENFNDLWNQKELLNNIIKIFAQNPNDTKKIKNELTNLNIENDLIEQLITTKINSAETSSMSLKALDEYVESEIRTFGKTLNQRYKNIIENNKKKQFNFGDGNVKYINENCLDNEIISPTTKCSFRETFKIINQILKLYVYNHEYQINNIVIETANEWNSVDLRNQISENQKYNETLQKAIKEKYGYTKKETGYDETYVKLVLLLQQDGKSLYSNKFIDYKLVVADKNYTQIDHIIAESISFDNSLSNKTLVLQKENQDKKQKTVKEYLSVNQYEQMLSIWKDLYLDENKSTYNLKKYQNLTFEFGDSQDRYNKMLGFIGRNLSDTRYATSCVLTALKVWLENRFNYLKKNNITDENQMININNQVNVIAINGKQTQKFRNQKYLDIKKDRDINNDHHSVDATILAILGTVDYIQDRLIWTKKIDELTGEVKNVSKFIGEDIFSIDKKHREQIKWKELKDVVEKFEIKYSHKINKKTNCSFYDETEYSTKYNHQKGVYEQTIKVKFMELKTFDEVKKQIKILEKNYGDGIVKNTYPDKQMYLAFLQAYKEGVNLVEKDTKLSKKNPFVIYMQKYCEVNNLDFEKNKKYLIVQINNKIKRVEKIKKISTSNTFIAANNFQKQKQELGEKFGSKDGFGFENSKEIWLHQIPNKKGILEFVISQINIKTINTLKTDKKFVIHHGTLLQKKSDNSIWRVSGTTKQQLELKDVRLPHTTTNKNQDKKEDRNRPAISTILKEYNFVNVDVLGNIQQIDLDKIFN